ncbi:hypothetical protein [Vibrio phage vB_pir03]|nr:hypothetical protein [Vibrio phage vB_pir03]
MNCWDVTHYRNNQNGIRKDMRQRSSKDRKDISIVICVNSTK